MFCTKALCILQLICLISMIKDNSIFYIEESILKTEILHILKEYEFLSISQFVFAFRILRDNLNIINNK